MSERLDDAAADALAQLVKKVISQPNLRRSFQKDPYEAAERAGIDISALPERIVYTLSGLSGEELRLVTELNEVFVQEGLEYHTMMWL